MRRSASGTKEKGRGENGGATNQANTHSVLISCAMIRFVNIAICACLPLHNARIARPLRAKGIDVVAITPKAAANSGPEPRQSVNVIRASIVAGQ
jgi:hypothetical protein